VCAVLAGNGHALPIVGKQYASTVRRDDADNFPTADGSTVGRYKYGDKVMLEVKRKVEPRYVSFDKPI
jgi:hypothetical protein